MTPTELASAARRAYNANDGDTFFSDIQIYEWIYDAEMALAMEAFVIKTIFTTSTVVGTREYSYPTNAIKVRKVTYDGENIEEITFREDDLLTGADQDSTSTGTPVGFVDFDQVLYLRPIPDAVKTLKIYCYTQPSGVPTASSVLETPDEYHPKIKLYLLAQMSVKDKNYEGARYYQQQWENELVRAGRFEAKKRRGSKARMVQNIDVLPSPIIGTL